MLTPTSAGLTAPSGSASDAQADTTTDSPRAISATVTRRLAISMATDGGVVDSQLGRRADRDDAGVGTLIRRTSLC
jgi:hypothetical protein